MYEYEFSVPVCRLYIIKSHTNLIPEASFFTGEQHEGVRSLETSMAANLERQNVSTFVSYVGTGTAKPSVFLLTKTRRGALVLGKTREATIAWIVTRDPLGRNWLIIAIQ